jgi:putative DNA primase/helicase
MILAGAIVRSPSAKMVPGTFDILTEYGRMKTQTNEIQYDYLDSDNKLLYQSIRIEYADGTKTFRQRRPDGNGGYVYQLNGCRRIPYRLPELLSSETDGYLFIVEGEKNVCDIIEHFRVVSTTFSGGSNGWRPEYVEYFQGRHIIILPDFDRAGAKFGNDVAAGLYLSAASVRVVDIPGLPDKGDVSDFIQSGGTVEQLYTLIEQTEPFGPLDVEAEPFNSNSEPAGRVEKFPLSDCGNGERFAKKYGHKARHNWDKNEWLIYDGKRWKPTEAEVRRLAAITARSIPDDLPEGHSLEQRQRLTKFALSVERSSGISNMLTEARAQKLIETHSRDFDQNPMLLNCLNGTIDLETGKLRVHDPANMITKICPVNFDPDATLSMFDLFMLESCKDDYEYMKFLQRSVGYSLTGDTSEEKLFLIHGPKNSGKSTFVEAIKSVLGGYALTTDFETFLQRKQVGGTRNDIARLDGSRLVVSVEVDEGKRLAAGLVKQLTGGDTIAARFLYHESFEFLPQFKLWLACNHTPRAADNDGALWRRILRLPFDNEVPVDKRNPQIKKILHDPTKAGPAILGWAVKGCIEWQRDGLQVPDNVTAATTAYRDDQDPLKDFFEDCCFLNEIASIPVAELRRVYDAWASEQGLKYTLSPRKFNERLDEKGCFRKNMRQNGNTVKSWCGIGLCQ